MSAQGDAFSRKTSLPRVDPEAEIASRRPRSSSGKQPFLSSNAPASHFAIAVCLFAVFTFVSIYSLSPDTRPGIDQSQFVSIVRDKAARYQNAINDIQRDTIKHDRDEELCRKFPNKKFHNWSGKLKTLYSDWQEVLSLKIEIGPSILVIDTDATSASVKRSLATSAGGEYVIFSGKIITGWRSCLEPFPIAASRLGFPEAR